MTTRPSKEVDAPIFRQKRIKQLNQLFKEKIAETMRLHGEKKLRFRKPPVVVVHATTLIKIMDRSARTAQRIMLQVRSKLGRQKDQYVSVTDFCTATGLDEDTVQRVLDLCT